MNTAEEGLIQTYFNLQKWLDSMKLYNDSQYGKGAIRNTTDGILRIILNSFDTANVLELVLNPQREWKYDRSKFEFVEALVSQRVEYKRTFSICTSGYNAVCFDREVSGVLILKSK